MMVMVMVTRNTNIWELITFQKVRSKELFVDVGQTGGMGESRKKLETMASCIKCFPLQTLTRIFSVACSGVEARLLCV